MNAALLLSLIEIAERAYAMIQRVRTEEPEVYAAAVSKHVEDSLAAAKAEALRPDNAGG